MPLRLHFTAADLARTRLAEGLRPMLELDIAVRLLQDGAHEVRFGAWRRQSLRRLEPGVRRLFDLIPPTGWTVGFLDHVGATGIEEAVQRVRATPAARVTEDMERWAGRARGRAVPGWTRALGGDGRLLGELADAVALAHREVIAPYQAQMDVLARTDQVLRGRQVAYGGLDLLLSGLNPRCIRWDSPVLELTTASGFTGDIHLAGRGLLLIPSVFGAVYPAFDETAEPQPWLTYPVGVRDTDLFPAPVVTARALSSVPDSLTALLGHTRAVVLWTIAEHPGCTTGELARRAGISPASASQHATVLRTAGLSRTVRHRNTALHTATYAGTHLLGTAG
ncbi:MULTISPECIES: winged helix-turn-helix domain-containing protein [Streptomyces]|uniref:ArsR family transcriptional regulator n=1 Tax=Streptomyces venezuelae TaxID=54571 RepID=A0A5P2B3T0_STRVZ|nr:MULTISPECIES: winged helix-turn-helix domain-containing protein [Streptomyces]NEA02694.1 helix-turn-helix transcriptional regulator [Streptomyces sp. SID10116]MYY86189.1 helix-turn-helix domain-containing protein [Streptomyces sp. SID335]MYZ17596.1 helix-turn-helix domain-containing protein [Streptomyces sp. SID337]NDZ87358.1 helix-turn-helix transcriptional regulator [Streptomyces sp. SID10115]NEB46392.1 helix-turn-helix transcriptional regulator [Streptomyces sp. SID339]